MFGFRRTKKKMICTFAHPLFVNVYFEHISLLLSWLLESPSAAGID